MLTISKLSSTLGGLGLALSLSLTSASAQILDVDRDAWVTETKPKVLEAFEQRGLGTTVIASPPLVGYTRTLLTVTNLGPNQLTIDLELIESESSRPTIAFTEDIGPYSSRTYSTGGGNPRTGFLRVSGVFERGEIVATLDGHQYHPDSGSLSPSTIVTAE